MHRICVTVLFALPPRLHGLLAMHLSARGLLLLTHSSRPLVHYASVGLLFYSFASGYEGRTRSCEISRKRRVGCRDATDIRISCRFCDNAACRVTSTVLSKHFGQPQCVELNITIHPHNSSRAQPQTKRCVKPGSVTFSKRNDSTNRTCVSSMNTKI